MADNISITAGAGTVVATDDIAGVHYQYTKQAFGADGTATLVSSANPLPVVTGAADPLTVGLTRGVLAPVSTFARAANTTTYTVGTAWANSTSSPTAGGGTLTGVVGASGKSALMTHIEIWSDAAPALPLQGELWLFDTAPTAVNDNAAFTVPDAQLATRVMMIPFALSTVGANSSASVDVGRAFLTVGSANLRYLVRVVNAYVPVSGEILSFRPYCQGLN